MTVTVETLQSISMRLSEDGRFRESDAIDQLIGDIQALHAAAQTASNYIHHIGANHTEAGKPHPQALLLANLDTALLTLKDFEV